MKEVWEQYKDTIYEVSNLGRVRSKKIRVKVNPIDKRDYITTRGGNIRKSYNKENGYKAVMLKIDDSKRSYLIHRLVAECFLPNPNNYRCVNHKDGDKTNNKVDNLEWCTHQENMIHAYKNGLIKKRRD